VCKMVARSIPGKSFFFFSSCGMYELRIKFLLTTAFKVSYPRKSVFLWPKAFLRLWFFQLVDGYTNTQKMGAKLFLFAAVRLCICVW
jgi:hypothetical protein